MPSYALPTILKLLNSCGIVAALSTTIVAFPQNHYSPIALHKLRHESNRSPSRSHRTATIFTPPKPIMLAAAAAASSSSSTWLRARPIRCLVLFVCSPILLPFLCAAFPLLCAAELCLRLCRRQRRRRKIAGGSEEENDDDDRLRRCEEGHCGTAEHGGEEIGILLLQRYLEDQLLLVGSMYDCGDDGELSEEDFGDAGLEDSRAPLLS